MKPVDVASGKAQPDRVQVEGHERAQFNALLFRAACPNLFDGGCPHETMGRRTQARERGKEIIPRFIAFGLVCLVIVAQERMRTVWDGVYSREQAERGHVEYDRRCADCHGDELEGDIVEHPALAGGSFRDKWNGENLGALFERIHRDMPQRKPGSLSRETTVDLIAYILSANDYPAGRDLPRDTPSLAEIRIESKHAR
jgi:S-disulfanyl-L-cysteine oxidoreductase SoxD